MKFTALLIALTVAACSECEQKGGTLVKTNCREVDHQTWYGGDCSGTGEAYFAYEHDYYCMGAIPMNVKRTRCEETCVRPGGWR